MSKLGRVMDPHRAPDPAAEIIFFISVLIIGVSYFSGAYQLGWIGLLGLALAAGKDFKSRL